MLALRHDQVDVVTARPHAAAPTAVLLRPDSYVAWASSSPQPDPTELEALRAALERWFGVIEPART
ncbi:hypothetical protein ACIBHX_34925 [Nonomuraea sp. NPDC050536]|uniref:aromatic-ring hydroxylase C-terminal domain-containing protein n=1 Tax=Nonomuraea sp. NPDC050536 TaxID=3364366 RepID=UPI0037CCBD21